MHAGPRKRLLGLVLAFHVAAGCMYLAPRRITEGPTPDGDHVMFRFYAPTARRVQIAGDWPGNNWARGDGSVGEANVGLMDDKNADGVWEIRVALPAGRYRYLFLVDENTWHTDPGNPEEIPGGPAQVCSQIVLHMSNHRLEIR